MLKSLAKSSDINKSIEGIKSHVDTAITIFGIYFTIILDAGYAFEDIVGTIVLLLVMLVLIYLIVFLVETNLNKKSIWNEYMNIAIEEEERELRK